MKADEHVSDVVHGSHNFFYDRSIVLPRSAPTVDGALGRPEGRPVRRYHSPVGISPGLQSETGTYLVVLNDGADAVGVEQQYIWLVITNFLLTTNSVAYWQYLSSTPGT